MPLSLLVVLGLLYSALGSARQLLRDPSSRPLRHDRAASSPGRRGASSPFGERERIGFIALLGRVSLAGLLVLSAIEPPARGRAPATLRAAVPDRLPPLPGRADDGPPRDDGPPDGLRRGVGSETQRPSPW